MGAVELLRGRGQLPTSGTVSVRNLLQGYQPSPPGSMRALLLKMFGSVAVNDPLVFTTPIITGGLAALGGWVTVTVNLDGSVRWQGHAHDSGADSYDFGISALVRTPAGRAIALAHSGHVSGTFAAGSRDHDWDETTHPRFSSQGFWLTTKTANSSRTWSTAATLAQPWRVRSTGW
jgi:hypothetical protein